VNHPLIAPPLLQSLPYCNAIAQLLRHIQPPHEPPCVCHTPYHFGNSNIVWRPILNTHSVVRHDKYMYIFFLFFYFYYTIPRGESLKLRVRISPSICLYGTDLSPETYCCITGIRWRLGGTSFGVRVRVYPNPNPVFLTHTPSDDLLCFYLAS